MIEAAVSSSRPLHVVQVVRSASYGGVENHVYELCRHFLAQGLRVDLVSLVDQEVRADFHELGIRIFRLHDRMGWSPRSLTTTFELRKLLRTLAPDVVHLHGIRPTLVGPLSLLGSRSKGRPAVFATLHGAYSLMAIDYYGNVSRRLLLLAKAFHWIGFALSDRVMVDCTTLVGEVRKVYRGLTWNFDRVARRKVRVAHNGIDLQQFENMQQHADIRQRLGCESGTVLIGSISRLDEPKKGTGVLLRAARIVLDECPNARFVICGEGYSRAELEALAAQLEIADRVVFLGFWKDALEVYRALDVFVLPSLSEGFPTVNLEAMAAGLPVVTTDVGGAAEAVHEGTCGFVVPPNDAPALAAAMIRLCTDSALRSTMGAHARKVVKESFGSDVTARRVMDAYREVVARSG